MCVYLNVWLILKWKKKKKKTVMHIQQSCELKQRSTADQRYPRGLLYSLNNNKNISTNSCKQHLSLENKYKMQLITFHGVGLVFMWATKWWRDEQSRGRLQMISRIMSCGDAGGDMERFLFFPFFSLKLLSAKSWASWKHNTHLAQAKSNRINI